MSISAPWLKDLNDAQRQAVTHGDGPLLVVAGAGTGKTMTLACRVAYLIEQGTPPERILLLTFTRRAAGEMLRRAGNMTDSTTTGRVWGGTFHATANRLLRMYGQAIGLAPNFTVMDESDAADLMNLIRNELGLAKQKRRFASKQTLVKIYSHTVNARRKLSDVLDTHFPWCREDQKDISKIVKLYTKRKRERNVVDYDDLLLLWEALCKAPKVGDAVADRFDHILVDEYQDTNAIQADILRAMRRRNNNIMVVGDDAQSIYSFRAATIRNILDFPQQFPGTRIVTLEQNYRSTQPILDASNAVMSQAKQRYTKDLFSTRASEQKPVLITCVDEAEQVDLVCSHVLDHLESGIPLQKQGVLFRVGHHSDMLEVELTRRNIPFHKFGGLKFIEAAHIKDMLALLRILENPHDEVSWFRILLLLANIGPRIAERIIDDLGVRVFSPEQSPLRRLRENPPKVPAAACESFAELRDVLTSCAGLHNGDGEPPLSVQLERLRAFYEPILFRVRENAKVRLRDIEQLEQIAERYKSRSRFITDLTLDPPTSTSDLAGAPFLEEDWLVLSTIHSAKGCEWDVVHILHAADGMIPSDMSTGSEEGVDEERRLFYVATTRAKDRLYLYFPLRYYHRRHSMGDRHSYAQLTRFLPKQMHHLLERRTADITLDEDTQITSFGIADVDNQVNELWDE